MLDQSSQWHLSTLKSTTNPQYRFLASERLTDIEIICGSYKFKAHKLVLAMASGFFNALSDSAFIEGQTSTVRLDEEQPALVARLLLFAYTSSYPTTPISDQPVPQFKMLPEPPINEDGRATEWTFRANIHVHMYQLADKYDMPLMKAQARKRFLIAFYGKDEYHPDFEIFGTAVETCHWSTKADMISYVYTQAPSVDRELRDIVSHYYIRRMNTTKDYRSLMESTAMRDLVINTPDFATDVALCTDTTMVHMCESCDLKKKPFLAWRCECGKVDSCESEGCRRKAKEATFCIDCCGIGCLAPI